MHLIKTFLACSSPIILIAHGDAALAQTASLADVFADNMVVQRDALVPVWGQGTPGSKLTVTLGEQQGDTIVADNGQWRLDFPADDIAGAFTLAVTESGRTVDSASNVVFGDVFLCSGQSNMDFRVENVANRSRVLEESSRYDIRIMKVARATAPVPLMDFDTDVPWSVANRKNLEKFSAVCWHMAQEVQKYTDRPIGLIQSTWGGTTIEDWVSMPALRETGRIDAILDQLSVYARDPAEAIAALEDRTADWAQRADPGIKQSPAWFAEDLSSDGWAPIQQPGLLERSGVPELSNFNGVIWLRKSVNLTRSQARAEATLRLATINERDTVWMNGTLIGSTADPNVDRKYTIPKGVLKPGDNVLAIRVIDERGSGGIRAIHRNFDLSPGNKTPINLDGEWQYRIAGRMGEIETPPTVAWMAPRGYTSLYNAMIAPLGPVALKGVAWYQGESNTGAEEAYADYLDAMINSWRGQFNNDDLAFVIAQLPAFGSYKTVPTDATWPPLREAQRSVADSDDHVEIVVTIDEGIEDDIHPAHKLEVGRRMGLGMMRSAFEQETATSPYPVAVARTRAGFRVEYADDVNLHVYSGARPNGFQACKSEAAASCKYVDAKLLSKNVVIVDADKDTKIVRYAWEDSPIVNLFSESGLPAAPFSKPVAD